MKQTALAMALGLALFGCNSSRPSANTAGADATGNIKPTGPAPDFDLENVAGGKLKSADLRGKVVIVDFWATWCEPCLSEIPKFNQMTDEYKGKDVEILGIT